MCNNTKDASLVIVDPCDDYRHATTHTEVSTRVRQVTRRRKKNAPFHAAFKGYDRIVAYFLQKVPQSINILNADRSYAIHKACLEGNIDILKLFYSHYPETIFSTDGHGRTVLHIAAKEPRDKLEKVVIWLLTLPNSGTLITSGDADGSKPSKLAERARNKKVLAKICSHSRRRF